MSTPHPLDRQRPPASPVRVGVVEAHATAANGRPLCAVHVRYPDLLDEAGVALVSPPLQVVQPYGGAGGPKRFRLPAVGQIVVVASLPGDDAAGPADAVVLGAVYPDAAGLPGGAANAALASGADVALFRDGTLVERTAEGLTVRTPLPVTVESEAPVVVRSEAGVYLGGEAGAEPVPLGRQLVSWLRSLTDWLATHTHTSAPSGSPTTPPLAPFSRQPDVLSDHTHTT